MSMFWPSSFSLGALVFVLYGINITLVLFLLYVSLFFRAQFSQDFQTADHLFSIFCSDVAVNIIIWSSAKACTMSKSVVSPSVPSIASNQSSMSTNHNAGPRLDPCGQPRCVLVIMSSVCIFLSVRKSRHNLTKYSGVLFCLSMSIMAGVHAELKAFFKSSVNTSWCLFSVLFCLI